MLYKIRWINDDTLICRESSIVMIFWLFVSSYHILSDTIISNKLCNAEIDTQIKGGFKTAYWILMARNVLILVLIFYYQFRVTQKHSYLQRVISTAGEH